MKMPIPDDWGGESFCDYSIRWPDSSSWRIILRGLLSNPSLVAFWDERTGDVTEVIDSFSQFLDGILDNLECGDMTIPIGSIFPYAGGNEPDGWLICDGRTLL